MLLSTNSRVRAKTKRSSTGCRTCRVRHVKCDEPPGACCDCTSTGRHCDGYDTQKAKNDTNPQPTGGPSKTVDRAMTSDERLCFSHFHGHTIPTLLQFFDSTLWQKLVLQLARYEAPVYHAVIALSSTHRNCEKYGMQLATPARTDPYLHDVLLVCCLFFVLIDLLRGRYEDALNHLRGGLCILRDLQVSHPFASQSLVEQCLVSTFSHLDILASHYDRAFPVYSPDNLPDVRVAFDNMQRSSYQIISRCFGMSDLDISLNYESLHMEQSGVRSRMVQLKQLFEPFCLDCYDDLSPKQQCGLNIVRLHFLSASICLKSLLLGSKHVPYTSDLEFPDRPSFTAESDVLPLLFIAATLCCGYSVRWPLREGPFDSNWLVYLSEKLMRLELEASCDEDPGFRETVFVMEEEKLSVDQMLMDITHSQHNTLDGLRRTRGMEDTFHEPRSSDFLNTFSEIKGIQSWSCVRMFTAATLRAKVNP
ncbi:hypothetical protein BJX99DRAFT_246905 [Aspergillus californicus]